MPCVWPMKVLWLREHFSWMGRHSGYEQLCGALETNPELSYAVVYRDEARPVRWWHEWCLKMDREASPFYTAHSLSAELAAVRHVLTHAYDLVHVLYAENVLDRLGSVCRARRIPLLCTVHQPPSWWMEDPERLRLLRHADGILTLTGEMETFMGDRTAARVWRVPHGVDTAFFRPMQSEAPNSEPHCLFSGSWLRDFKTLRAVIDRVKVLRPEVRFDLLIGARLLKHPDLDGLQDDPRVSCFRGIGDEELR